MVIPTQVGIQYFQLFFGFPPARKTKKRYFSKISNPSEIFADAEKVKLCHRREKRTF